MKHGHIKTSRKQFDGHDLLWADGTPFDTRSAWTWLIQLAQWRANTRMTKYGPIPLARGELVASLRHLAKEWKWSTKKVRRYLEILEKEQRIKKQSESRAGTVYLIAKYDTYQGTVDPEDTTEETAQDTIGKQSGNKNKQEKQVSKKISFPASVYDWLHREWFARFGLVGEVEFRAGIKRLLVAGVRPGQLARAFGAYREDRNEAKKDGKFAWFLSDVQRHIAEGDLCAIQLMPADAFGLTQAEANEKIRQHQERLAAQDAALYARIISGQVAA